ncbi:unnamed protein product [Adineta steineri]|uniref:RNA helicase n=1 Tax=Adineta steineri TaxID=433720 RepID=A0A813WKS6_9BILA|nr:unnamed protein product [Adineta steineri]
MASNINTSSKWSVRITSFLPSMDSTKLAQEFRLPRTLRVSIPRTFNNNNNPCAWINGFINEEDANEFVRQWSGASIQGQKIKCTVSSRPNDQTSRTQFESRIEPCDSRPSSTEPKLTRNVTKNQGNEDKRFLCRYANKGTCREKSSECKYRHQRCINYESCKDLKCELAHTKPDLGRGRSDSCSSTNSFQSVSSTLSANPTTRGQCRNGIKCFNVDCTFEHPDGWNACIDGEQCEDYDCKATHPFKRKIKCCNGSNCKNADCKYLHPKTRATMCQLRGKCERWNCQKLHPHTRTRRCPNKEKCTNLECLCLHPQERSNLLCPLGGECREISCKLNHPSERPSICDQPDICSNFNCTRLHQSHWNPCEEGDDCRDEQCSKIHSPERNLNLQQKNKKNQKTKKINSKSLEQRNKEREKASLPILCRRDDFCQRLEREHVLIVTAETGSGKSTQLPQYAAEHFGSLIVCTQPRVVAALSLARRVAEEYDGKSVGNSVGYQVGSGNRVVGSDIMFMTDAALIRESQRDPDLKHIRVLIVDEAHERSLNTDIVIGISKLLLSKRPNDFYVVIASATIDPVRFLQFFERSTSTPLKVEGRVFEVTTAEKPPPPNCSDQKLIISHVVPSIIELYPKHEGHTLVFLPGQSEIERALKTFKSKLPDDCVPLPLYGSQSPEDQEKVIKFNEIDKRMIVFCTNVAETSLTIPNVRLVIDSGLAKEARYDIKRRLTVIETVRISRSSADQRKGRAGRTARGHCVRLYEDQELKRQNIEPEILRSSLDLVLLQLIRLNFNPKTFPFMDQPPSDTIHNSLDLLTKLQCINEQKITKRGELFTELSLDPRLSSFIIDIYMDYKTLLELVVAIVAILSAPGTIFFMGGNKEEARARVALQAHSHKSDLIHLYSVYNAWKNASGNESQGKCSKCSKLIKYCICRIKYSNANSLNNKILQHIYTSCLSIMKQIRNARWLQPRDEMSEDTNKILGIHLAKLFPEQCGYLLVPELPIEGVRLVSTDIRANITNTSVFMQKLNKDADRDIYQYFVAMTITQLPTGNYIIERLHPIPKSDVVIQSSIQNLTTINCIGSEFANLLREKLKAYESESWAKWIVYQYDRTQCRFMISGPETTKSTILPVVQRCQNEIMKKLSEVYELLECGPIKAKFQSGLVCTRINEMSSVLKMNLQNVPCQTTNELKDWIKKMMGIEWNEIKEHGFHTDKNTNNKHVYIVFKSEDTYRCAISKISSSYLIEQENQFGRSRENEKESWGRELVIQVPSNITADDIIQRYGNDSILKCILINEKKDKFLKLDNLPITIDETYLRQCLQTNNGPTPKHVRVGRTTNNLTGWAKITFQNETERNAAASRYELELCQTSFPITIPGRKGPPKLIQTKVMKTDESDTAENLPKNFFRIVLINREAALTIYTSSQTATNSDWIIDGSATITILRTDLYPNFQQILDGICEKFKVQVKCKDIPKPPGKRCIFSHGSPQKTSLAASMLSQNFAPINIKLNTERQKQLFRELEEIGQIHKWARELSLQINANKYFTNIEIRGPQTSQGQFMRRIADYSDDFDTRFREHELSTIVATFFGREKAASVKLKQIHSKWSSKLCSVSFNSKTATITILGKANVSLKDLNLCENEVLQLLDEITANSDDIESDEEDDEEEMNSFGTERQCVFCKQKSSISTSLFRICGHAYCRCAAQSLASTSTCPLQCKDCQTNIHIRDIEMIFNNNQQLLTHLLKNSIQEYLTKNAQQDDRVFCPNDECEGLIKLSNEYQTCLTCGQNVCSKCQTIDDELHLGRTCIQFEQEKKRRGEFLPQLFLAAKKFVEENWPLDQSVRPIGRIDENPYLEKQYKSLTRFYKGNEVLGHAFPPDLSKGFFAYHGCPFQAIDAISQTGFDPKRRSGQACGRGEYFGVTAVVSHGYSQKGGTQAGFSQMFISFILQCTQVTKREGFCYVVDNPVDWTYAFNLPVLIVTYGPSTASRLSPFPLSIPQYIDNEPSWNAPFRWYWRQDNGNFEPYNDTINEILENFYEHWKFNRGLSEVVTPPVTRYIDDTPQTYQIDFQKNRQMNTKTSYQRLIDRRPLQKPADNLNWFYCNEHGNWIRYELLVQNQIEQGFQSYRSGRGSSTINIHFPGRPETYEINFLRGQQTNKTSNAIKNIKRE